MNFRTPLTAADLALVVLITAGGAVSRGQETPGASIDDASIPSPVKGRMLDNPSVAGTRISVEKDRAERIAHDVDGVQAVKYQIALRP